MCLVYYLGDVLGNWAWFVIPPCSLDDGSCNHASSNSINTCLLPLNSRHVLCLLDFFWQRQLLQHLVGRRLPDRVPCWWRGARLVVGGWVSGR